MSYTLNQWEYLTRYTEDGRCRPTTTSSNAISGFLPLEERVGCKAIPWTEPGPVPSSTASC
ncbi:hypothetical protein [Sinorhizobium meliloti]|uniref:hypothetical protein n=1 Tax=Rhizobium meliloti TaxID=382 RepID=UPI00338FA212